MNTRQTAEIMAAHLQPEEGKRQIAGLAPSDDVEPTRERVQKESGKFNDRRPSAISAGWYPYSLGGKRKGQT